MLPSSKVIEDILNIGIYWILMHLTLTSSYISSMDLPDWTQSITDYKWSLVIHYHYMSISNIFSVARFHRKDLQAIKTSPFKSLL